ncbi:MAG: class I SAM-dependent methyltransferase [Acidimicrobiales bacterium]
MNDHDHSHDHGDDHDHSHGHGHDHGHGHANDQGFKGAIRYLKMAPEMWNSTINDAVLGLVDPKPSEHVLDIGAGMGPGMALAARYGAKVTAVEPTPFMRRVLSFRRMLQSARKRITVADGSAEKLPVPDASIDALWSVNAMHHWIDPQQAAVEIARVLKPGGRVVLVDEDFADPQHPEYERFKDRHASDADSDSDSESSHNHHGFTMVDAEDMGRLLSAAGVGEVQAEKRYIANRPAIVVEAKR